MSTKPFVIVCFGDSITCEWEEPHYPAFWQELLDQKYGAGNIKVISAGVNGETAQDSYSRLDRDVLFYHPNLVTVMYGHNDLYLEFTPQEYAQSLEAIIQAVQKAGVKHLWLLTPNLVWGQANQTNYTQYLTALKILSQSTHTPLIDLWSHAFIDDNLDSIYDYFSNTTDPSTRDWVHPNESGHRLLAKYLFSQFISQIKL